MISISNLGYLSAHGPSAASDSQFRSLLFYFRRRRPDRHGRAQGFTGRRRRVGAQQIGHPLEGGEHALVLVGSRRQRVDGGDWPRLDIDRGHRIGPNVAGARLEVGAGRRRAARKK